MTLRSAGPDSEPTAAACLGAIAAGDFTSFQRFYQRYAPALLAYLCQLCRDRQLAEDLVQEVFVTVWQKAASYRPDRGDPNGWLYAIARNKLIDHWRKVHPTQELGEFDLDQLPLRGAGGPDLVLTLRSVLARVSPEQRTAIELAYFGGLTYEETAKRLQLPLGTLKSRIRVGLRAMRQILEAG
jgi:RNA polymerase sigma-70 factor (ECF subfamily)